jgi:tRNA (mo5U34)-methyltransferase
MLQIYPAGLDGRSVLDCACNCGGYLFWAKELGAGQCFGFDIREHWIEQARFLREHRQGPGADIRFEVCDLYDLPLGLDRHDVTLFQGIFYHLPNPIEGLKIAADLTEELLIISTAARTDLPDGTLVSLEEGVTQVMSGAHRLAWFPTGPDVLIRILAWVGFPYARCTRWRRAVARQPKSLGRIEVIASRSEETLHAFDQGLDRADLGALVRQMANVALPPEATVVVASEGMDELLDLGGRRAWHFPQNEDGSYRAATNGAGLIASLEELKGRGAGYLLVPAAAKERLEQASEVGPALWERFQLEFRELGVCEVFSLHDPPTPGETAG